MYNVLAGQTQPIERKVYGKEELGISFLGLQQIVSDKEIQREVYKVLGEAIGKDLGQHPTNYQILDINPPSPEVIQEIKHSFEKLKRILKNIPLQKTIWINFEKTMCDCKRLLKLLL